MRNLIWSIEDKIADLNIRRLELEIKVLDALDGTIVGKTIDYIAENPKKSLAIVSAGVATGGAAYVAAPAIAAAIGTTGVLGKTATTGAVISKLTGAPLVNASLAKIGGGAISIGGKGIAGGKFVIATTTATTTTTTNMLAASKLNKKTK